MNLNQMAQLVCKKVRKTDDESISICKDFLRQRHEMVWHEELWRDSLAIVPVSVTPTTDTLHAAGFVLMPNLVAEIIAVRTDSRELSVEPLESYFRRDIDSFDASGEPVNFACMAPVCYQFATANGLEWTSLTGAPDDETQVHMRYVDSLYAHKEVTLYLASEFRVSNVLWVESVTKPATNGQVVSTEYPVVDELVRILMEPTDTEAPKFQRIRLIEKPTSTLSLKVLAKTKLVGMARDEDSTNLRKMDNCLMAFAEHDMQKRLRQHGKAKEALSEAVALVAQLKETEVLQRAHSQRLIPDESAYAYDYDFSNKGHW